MILVTGADGQLGRSLKSTQPKNKEVLFANKSALDITDNEQLDSFFLEHSISTVVNCAAYTAVDKAESDKQLAMLINTEGVKNLAKVSKKHDAKLVHISTDYVFDGKQSNSYTELDSTNPQSVYGLSKLSGERAARVILPERLIIIRTSWLYSKYKNNFVKTMLRLLKDKNEISVVKDQQGSPTWAANLANIIWRLLENKNAVGVYHYADKGVTNWYNFACFIQNEALKLQLLDKKIPIHAINSSEYPQAAPRPKSSDLNSTKIIKLLKAEHRSWKESLIQMLTDLKGES